MEASGAPGSGAVGVRTYEMCTVTYQKGETGLGPYVEKNVRNDVQIPFCAAKTIPHQFAVVSSPKSVGAFYKKLKNVSCEYNRLNG